MVVDAPFGKRNFCRDQGVVVVNTRPMKESDSNHSAEGERIASAARTLGDGEGLQGRVVAHTLTLLQAAAQRLGVKTPDPQIRFDLRGRVAGQVRFGSRGPWVIRYNPVLMQANAEDFLSTTVPPRGRAPGGLCKVRTPHPSPRAGVAVGHALLRCRAGALSPL
jgi:hypothetical protein